MSERDELAHIIGGKLITRSSVIEIANAVRAAGYSKPRTITTAEELEALPVESVVRSDFGVTHEKDQDFLTSEVFWSSIGTEEQYTSGHITLPATVLYEPGAS